MTIGPRLQVEQVQTDDSSKNLNVVFDERSGSIEIDYSQYYERIASALEEISQNTSRIKELAEDEGLNFKGPYDWLNFVTTYKYLIEQGRVNDASVLPNKQVSDDTINNLQSYIDKIRNLPRW
jgi:hypothetical protein